MTTKRAIFSLVGIIVATDLVVTLLIFVGAIVLTHFGSELEGIGLVIEFVLVGLAVWAYFRK